MSLQLRGVKKTYGRTVALSNCSLEVETGEILSLVGPSGCGKSTVLNIVAGFLSADEGEVRIDALDVRRLSVRERQIAYIMDGLGLYPHLSVFENVAYPLRVRQVTEGDILRRVATVISMTGLMGLEMRRPSELSGGQRQRVAIARALVRDDATVLLADECFSDLDAQLKLQIRGEFRVWQKKLALACIFVTHDQEEALALGDRIALMNNGKVEQIGTPDDVYARPETLFVAGFLGRPAMNLLKPVDDDGKVNCFGEMCLPEAPKDAQVCNMTFGVRPENVSVSHADKPGIRAKVEWAEPLYPDMLIHLNISGQRLTARTRDKFRVEPGAEVSVQIDRSRFHLFDRHTGLRI